MAMIAYELDRIRAAVDRATNACPRITVLGGWPSTIGVELTVAATEQLIKRIEGALSREFAKELGAGATSYEVIAWQVGT